MRSTYELSTFIVRGQGDRLDPLERERANDFLSKLGIPNAARASADHDDLARLLSAADRLPRIFGLRTPAAPALHFIGAEADPAILGPAFADTPAGSIAGSGLTFREAFEGCVGEAVEFLCQFGGTEDGVEAAELDIPAIEPFDAPDAPARAVRPSGRWMRATRLSDGAIVALPSDRCLRYPKDVAPPRPFALSTGCGAGRTVAEATLHGLLELVERDATALWWRGGLRGRAIDPESEIGRCFRDLLRHLRGDAPARRSWLIDITTDLGVGTFAAISCAADGFGMACGFAARCDPRAAARAAIKEMCHIELAYDVVAAKLRERGDAALNATDRRHLARARGLDAPRCPLLHGETASAEDWWTGQGHAETDLPALVALLSRKGIDAFSVDLTRPLFNIPVVRVVAPRLQLDPCAYVGRRLRDAIARSGGADAYTHHIPLL